jgi:hypothetical protein
VKSEQEKIEKYSIKDIEPLIDSIIKTYPKLTEAAICLTLNYNEDYISQLRSREKSTGQPQVSVKFYSNLKNFSLHNANYINQKDIPNSMVSEPLPEYGIKGKWGTGNDEFINALLEEKDRAIKKAEEFAKKMEAHYEDAKLDKDKLFTQLNKLQTSFDDTLKTISENLKEAAISLKSNHDSLLAIGRTVRSNDAEMMEALDHLEGNPVGTRQKRSHTVQKALRQRVEAGATGKKAGTGKISKDVNEKP